MDLAIINSDLIDLLVNAAKYPRPARLALVAGKLALDFGTILIV
jgi:hypothetical protein